MNNELNGVIVIDKPANITSAKVVAIIKKLLAAKKVGHAGTLDPEATGVLLCCINKATKLAGFFLTGTKKYEAVLHLGVETDTQDATGKITSTSNELDFTEKTIQAVFRQFEGTIEQVPPAFSALKHKGTPLYKFARKGNFVRKSSRNVFISYNKILKINMPFISFEACCSSGTYIRTLCSDIGKELGCGGHLNKLRRIESSGFTINEAVTLSELEQLVSTGAIKDKIISMSDALRNMPEYIANEFLTEKIKHGIVLTKKEFMPRKTDNSKEFIKIIDKNNNLVAVVKFKKENNRYNYCCVFN
ncbi:MAG: tRNA pseudouridine(55) synthase TruB [Proteobacteria bacterium]|nr:tRNA pseudouridine(55) synthase TruB [Pseudomonadota bacterium]MBU4259223.1 tRNA pseudouridine(55) synthase TruB [Pseudomonadota bacterium]MBU4286809.1 tRNA pseudouridine(55) synthase TruB [Pseudomonadota bacterium]MBU4415149.1 tRNA pseudouridine(55) synthase TruB [Pseudomonadota bacterium]MCG2757919.1 tRNA pseudouridine(55) synthase TruB [Desulfobacteraceae bacterium]